MAKNYDLIFGQGASSQYAWSDSDYQKGWQTVGSTPPTAEQFDALQRRSDTKAKDLNNRLSPLETTASKALARVTPAANRLPYFNSSNSATTTAISDFTKTLLDDKDAATARATLGAPSTTGANASGSWNINAATATKLATARKINITGNATGAATFDGSGDISISTTVNESKHAAAADALNSMGNKTAIEDGTREPLNLSLYQVFKNGYPASYGNLLSIGGAGGGELLAEWSGVDKGIGHLYYRNRRDYGNLWSEWRTVAFTSDINNFAPTKTGDGASGTWGINISGNAASATKLATARKIGGVSFDGSADITLPGVNAAGTQNTSGKATTAGTADTAKACSGNAATATKLATPRKIELTGNATGAATFDGSGDVSADVTVNESEHAAVADVVSNAIHPRGVSGNSGYIFYGTLTIPQTGDFFKLEVLGGNGFNSEIGQSREGTLYFRTGNYTPSHYAAYSEYHRNGAGGLKFFVVKDSGTQYRIYGGLVNYTGTMQVIPYVGQKSSFDLALTNVSALPDGADEVEQQQLIYAGTVNNFAPTKTGGGASGTWGIDISGNAASATNADKLDGAHLADVYRQVGGHNTPTITSIIDWNTMKACNGGTDVRNINNTTYGVTAYGGDSDFSSGVLNGYERGSFYLTQDYTNFDKLCFLFCNDSGGKIGYTMVDVFLLNYIMTNYSIVNLVHDDSVRWYVKGYSNKGTEKYKVSTKRIISAPSWDPRSDQNNCGIIDVLGIKY